MIVVALALLVVCLALVWLISEERKAHRKEIQTLLNRIQHPDVPVATDEFPASTKPHHLPWDDDNAWREHVGVN